MNNYVECFNAFLCSLDIDECMEQTDNCEQICGNTIGSYKCFCRDGFIIDEDGYTCDGKNNCQKCL